MLTAKPLTAGPVAIPARIAKCSKPPLARRSNDSASGASLETAVNGGRT